MNRFEQRIKSARQYQRGRYGTIAIALVGGVLVVALTVVFMTRNLGQDRACGRGPDRFRWC